MPEPLTVVYGPARHPWHRGHGGPVIRTARAWRRGGRQGRPSRRRDLEVDVVQAGTAPCLHGRDAGRPRAPGPPAPPHRHKSPPGNQRCPSRPRHRRGVDLRTHRRGHVSQSWPSHFVPTLHPVPVQRLQLLQPAQYGFSAISRQGARFTTHAIGPSHRRGHRFESCVAH